MATRPLSVRDGVLLLGVAALVGLNYVQGRRVEKLASRVEQMEARPPAPAPILGGTVAGAAPVAAALPRAAGQSTDSAAYHEPVQTWGIDGFLVEHGIDVRTWWALERINSTWLTALRTARSAGRGADFAALARADAARRDQIQALFNKHPGGPGAYERFAATLPGESIDVRSPAGKVFRGREQPHLTIGGDIPQPGAAAP